MRLFVLVLCVATCVNGQVAAPPTPQGFINYRTYEGDQRDAVRAMTARADGVFYPKRAEGPYNGIPQPDPGDHEVLPPSDVRNNYMMELVGYFYPPKDGNLMLAIASDEAGELHFSTDDSPLNKKLVATEPQWNAIRKFGGGDPIATRRRVITDGDAPVPRPENWSPYINVQRGKPYFIQALAMEYGGGDNLAVAFRYEEDPEFADGDFPIPGRFLSPYAEPDFDPIPLQPSDAAAFARSKVMFSVGLDVRPPITLVSIKWTKNGLDLPNSNTRDLMVVATADDNGAKFKAIITTSAGIIQSREATLTVVEVVNEFTHGVALLERWLGIAGNTVNELLSHPHFRDSPDEVRVLGALDSSSIYGNYGARITGFIIPEFDGEYRFFIRSDDASLFLLSPDGDASKAVLICEETICCEAFKEPNDTAAPHFETSLPQRLKAGQRYAYVLYFKQAGGGDYLQVAWRKEGDRTQAENLNPLGGCVLAANAKPSMGEPVITKQPLFPPLMEGGRTYRFSVDGFFSPAELNFPLFVQWQKNGVDIPGATGKTLTIRSAQPSDSGTYRAIVRGPGCKSVISHEASIWVSVNEPFPPVPSASSLLNGGQHDIGVGFDISVKVTTARDLANYSLSAGKIEALRIVHRPATGFDASLGVQEYFGIVLVASGLTPGETYQLTVRNVEDLKGNRIPAPGATVTFRAEHRKTWSVVGANESGFANDVVRHADDSFDVVSSGVTFWADYDEGTFVHEEVTGDFDAKVRLIEQDPSSQSARCGLMAREALDEGKGRIDRMNCLSGLVDGAYCVPRDRLFSRLQTVHANPTIRWDAGVANNAYENHYRDETTYARDWVNQLQSADGGFGPLNYPDVWMRLKREGDVLVTYRSIDGQNWVQMTRRNFPNLALKLYVGPFFMPDLAENGTMQGLGHAVLAKFRNYTITTGICQPDELRFSAIKIVGGKVELSWLCPTAVLQASTDLATWTDVTDAGGVQAPRLIDPAAPAHFWRLRR